MNVEYSGIARLVQTASGISQAEILLDGTMTVVQLMFRGDNSFVEHKLQQFYPNVNVVPTQVFLCEVDHIKLFDCRSDDQSWTAPMSKDSIQSLQEILQKQQENINQSTGEFGEVVSS